MAFTGTPTYHGTTRYANPYKQNFDSLVTAGPDPVTTPAPATTKSPYHTRTSDKKKAHSMCYFNIYVKGYLIASTSTVCLFQVV